MSCAASPLILMPDHYWPFPILSILQILNGVALDAEQIYLTHILFPIIPWNRLCAFPEATKQKTPRSISSE